MPLPRRSTSTHARSSSGAAARLIFAVSAISLAAVALSASAAGCTDEADPASAGPADASSDTAVVVVPDAADASNGCVGDLDANGLWRHLGCSGLYSSLSDKTLAAGVMPYKPGVEFWSDGAEKQRWVFLPAGTKIDIGNFDEWKFPPGAKLWKEFKVGGKRIETRIFTKVADDNWLHASYRWNADESDAVSQPAGEKVASIGPDGGPYEIPTAAQCDQCHLGRNEPVLGFDAVSLGLAAATGETLEKLATDGWLSGAPPKTSLAFPGSDVAGAAIGWIHTNCGACHAANSSANAAHRSHFRVRATDLAPADGGTAAAVEDLDLWKQGYCVDTFRTDSEVGAPFKYIRGGNADKSLMYVLASRRVGFDDIPGPGVQMPPLVSRAVDQEGVARVREWIETLPPCE